MNSDRRDSTIDEISRDDPRFKCRMCGKPILGMHQKYGSYDAMFYCSRECEQGHSPCCICLVCTNVFLFVLNGWLLAFLISGVPMSMTLLVIGLFVTFLIINIILADQAVTSWTIRKRIIRNRTNTPPD